MPQATRALRPLLLDGCHIPAGLIVHDHGKVLSDAEIADLTEYVYRQFIEERPGGDGGY